MKFIIQEYRPDLKRTYYVCARPGFSRTADGKQRRDGTCLLKSGPEHTYERNRALEFKSHRAAARVANKCPSSQIVAI